ncbi:MAG: hypothetical protein J1F22_04770 [Lachnospiraceae bacterium]|nr:hypothetical protein [Lachnospiraceae bacterium]
MIHIRGILSHFILLLLLFILMWTGVTYVSQNIQYSSAKMFFGSVIQRLEDGYMDEKVVTECMERAEKNGYQLLVERGSREQTRDAKVRLSFSFTFPIIQKTKQYRIEGYAR